MISTNYKDTHQKVASMIERRKFHDAIRILRNASDTFSSYHVKERLHKIEQTYQYMIHYLVEGYPDLSRENLLSDIAEDLWFVNDLILRNAEAPASDHAYYSTKRLEDVRKTDIRSLLNVAVKASGKAQLAMATTKATDFRQAYDEALSEVFSFIWTMFGAGKNDYSLLVEAVLDADTPFDMKAQIISALLLSNLAFYDRNAFASLLDIYDADVSQKISARALVAIMFVMRAHHERVEKDIHLKNRFELWKDSIISYRRLREVLMNIIRTRDTERISSKMQNEVLPELMKLRPEIIDRLKNFSRDADMEMLEVNPEWEEILHKNGLGDKLKELTEMQLEGGDVMMVAFSNLKSFPFFNNISNWFLPFSPNHSVVSGNFEEGKAFSDLLDMEGVMCDSDKFSFALSLARMPAEQKKMMMERLDSQLAQLSEAMADQKLKSSVPEFDTEAKRYVRDIYRFFKLFRKKEEFKDPFLQPFDFLRLPFLSDILSDQEIVRLVGEFYFKRGYYSEALPLLMIIDKTEGDKKLLWEKIGYCHNALNNLEEAVVWYKKAELLNPDSLWLIKKLAVCYRLMNRFDDAAEYYAKALGADPDNYSLLMSSGNCLLELGDTRQAIAAFYHADYVKPERPASWRALAWANLLEKDYEKSLSYYDKLIRIEKPSANDLLNAGHAYFLRGDLKKAADCYRKTIFAGGFDINKLEESIAQDLPVIVKAGGSAQDLNLLIDRVKYMIDDSTESSL